MSTFAILVKQKSRVPQEVVFPNAKELYRWMEDCIGEPIPPIVELEEALRDGVALAKLTRVFSPELVPRIFESPKLQFRHSDNIDRFFRFLRKVELPDVRLLNYQEESLFLII
jgi:hypothetical protein